MYCDQVLGCWGLYRNTIGVLGPGEGDKQGCIAIQPLHLRHGVGLSTQVSARDARSRSKQARRLHGRAGAGRHGRRRTRRWGARGAEAHGALRLARAAAGVGRARHGSAKHGRGARGAAGARGLGARAGQGCALGALSLFLARIDLELFLSQFLNIVREPGS